MQRHEHLSKAQWRAVFVRLIPRSVARDESLESRSNLSKIHPPVPCRLL